MKNLCRLRENEYGQLCRPDGKSLLFKAVPRGKLQLISVPVSADLAEVVNRLAEKESEKSTSQYDPLPLNAYFLSEENAETTFKQNRKKYSVHALQFYWAPLLPE